MIKDIKKDMFHNQRDVIVITDLNTFANSTTGIRDIYLCDRDNVKEIMAKCKCPAEYIGIDDASGKLGCDEQQVKPPYDIDKKVSIDEDFDEEEYIELIKSYIKDMLELPNYDDIHMIFRDVRIVDGMRKYSYHFIVDKIRITLSTLRALIISKGYDKVFDMQIYNSNAGLYCLYSDKKKNMQTKQIVSVGELKIRGDPSDDIYKYFPSYILDSFVDYDEKFKHLPKKKKKVQNAVVTNSNIVVNKIDAFFRELTDGEKTLIRELVMECLSKERANDYGEWLNVGWCLYNISQTDFCYQLWDAFSAQGDTYKGQGETSKLWNSMKTT
ncbi:MAG TPA: PriCT-2 domain-containing protein, partial [Allocoleopsis sp.]